MVSHDIIKICFFDFLFPQIKKFEDFKNYIKTPNVLQKTN